MRAFQENNFEYTARQEKIIRLHFAERGKKDKQQQKGDTPSKQRKNTYTITYTKDNTSERFKQTVTQSTHPVPKQSNSITKKIAI